jgi:pyrroline-5-carboxylate reductase
MSDDATFEDVTVVLIGCGKMGSALATGWAESGPVDGSDIVCIDTDRRQADTLADELEAEAGTPAELASLVDEDGRTLYVVAVKPKDIEGVVRTVAPTVGDRDLVVSIAAGVPLASVSSWLDDEVGDWNCGLVRAMPNTPALVGRGVTGVYAPANEHRRLAEALFRGVGAVVSLKDEDDFDALTAVSGSGPAYFFAALEALADGAVAEGLDRETARTLAVETLAGSAELAARSDEHTAELKDQVVSPGGTTAAGLVSLEESGFRAALINAVKEAANRSREMMDS